MRLVISDHAYARAKERLSLNEKAFKKLVALGYCYGVQAIETKGALKAFLYATLKQYGNTDAFIYAEHVFVLTGQRLVTVYRLPNDLIKHLPKTQAA